MAAVAVRFPGDPSTWDFDQAGTPYYSHGLRERFRIDALKTGTKATECATNADIGYEPDEVKYLKRSENRLKTPGLPTAVPEGWPNALAGPLVWTTNDFRDEGQFVYHLSDADKTEVRKALEHFKDQELDGDQVSRENFPLPVLSSQLGQVCRDIYEGHGFAIIRGLDVEEFSAEDLTVVYLGISSYVAERRGKQDQRGSMLSIALLSNYVRVVRADTNTVHVVKRTDARGDRDNMEKPFHNDTVTDCLGLLTRNIAAGGGQSILCSVWTVYNELASTRPDILHVLAEPTWPFDTFGREPKYYERAALYYYQGNAIANFSRRLLVGHIPDDPRSEGIPGLTEAQAEALDAIHFVAKKHEIKTRMEKGDIRLINNMAVLHRREAFDNSDRHSRHLVRLWANNELMCWKLPPPLRLAWARVFEDDERECQWDVEPPAKDDIFLRVAGSCD